MVFVQLAYAFSLNDVCDWRQLKRRAIAGVWVTPSVRNTLSHANKGRSADFVQEVPWGTLAHLQRCEPVSGGKRKGAPPAPPLQGAGAHSGLIPRGSTLRAACGCRSPCSPFVRDGAGGQLHGLGAAPSAQSKPPGRQRQTAGNESPAGRGSRGAATESTPRSSCTYD
jgi:hypothetical protein